MMDCERYGANVFDVIELINRDYPRGGIAQPGLTAGTCLRKDFAFSEERSNAPGMLLAVSRVHESVPLFLVDGVKRRLGGSLRERKVAVLGLAFKRDTDDERDSLSHKLVRLLERELADVAVHDPVVAHADRVASTTRSPAPTSSSSPPTTARTRRPEALQAIADARRRADCLVVDPWNALGAAQVFAYANEIAALRRVSRVLVTGGAGTIGAAVVRRLLGDPDWEVRVSDQREAPAWMREGCEVHTGDLRDSTEAREAIAGCTHVIHLAAIVGGIANFHKLPHTLTEVNNALYNAVFRAALDAGRRALHLRVARSMVFERADAVPDDRGVPAATARRRSRPTASRSSPARSTAAPRTTSTACRTRSAARSTPTGRARCPRTSRASPTRCPDLIAQVAAAAAAAADLRLRRADAHAHARRRHRRRHRRPRWRIAGRR